LLAETLADRFLIDPIQRSAPRAAAKYTGRPNRNRALRSNLVPSKGLGDTESN
jgi:hypothetical protein